MYYDGYTNYALEGYEHDVVDYLLKPVSFERFYMAVEKAWKRIRSTNNEQKVEINTIPVHQPAPYVFIKIEHRLQKITVAEILYVEGLQNYLVIHTATDKIMSLQTFQKLEVQLPLRGFVRVHKSYLVALQHITSVERSLIYIGQTTIPIGESYRRNFFQRLQG